MSTIHNFFAPYADDDRADAAEKVTGRAKFTAEHAVPNLAYGLFVCSTIAKGTVTKINEAEALKAPGVLDVISFQNCPNVPGYNPAKGGFEWWGLKTLHDNKVRFYGQPVALLVADSFENAMAALKLVQVTYEKEKHETDFEKIEK